MTAAAAGIGFALHETADWMWDWSLIAALLAVILWAFSFAAGIWSRQAVMQAMNSNALYLEALAAQKASGAQISKDYMAKHAKNAGRLRDAQLWLLVLGALAYMGGHIWHLAEQSGSSPRVSLAQPTAEAPPPQPNAKVDQLLFAYRQSAQKMSKPRDAAEFLRAQQDHYLAETALRQAEPLVLELEKEKLAKEASAEEAKATNEMLDRYKTPSKRDGE